MVASDNRVTARVEELVLYALLIVTGAFPVVGALRTDGALGAEATIGLILLGLGLIGVATSAAHAFHGES
jgi:hypothetical protein